MKDPYYEIDKQNIRNSVTLLDMFCKNYCRYPKDYERFDDLKFRCNGCVFLKEDEKCMIKEFKCKNEPDYINFGSMGDL